VIENKPGAASNIGTEYVANAGPDGYTILMPISTNTVNVALYRNLKFDFMRDIVPIAGIAKTAFAITAPASFPPKRCPSSSHISKPIPARSTWARLVLVACNMCPASCSSS